ncbi:hypothetical protein BDZ89DRAFT_785786 [Hymenopellis radicata]|nr:hypothetical protein BDZ89DRAFT_785786 [Hymenopellis radicata]
MRWDFLLICAARLVVSCLIPQTMLKLAFILATPFFFRAAVAQGNGPALYDRCEPEEPGLLLFGFRLCHLYDGMSENLLGLTKEWR